MVAILAALAAALFFAVAAALQHRSAGLVTGSDSTPGTDVSGFLSKTLRHPLWLVGSIADLGGFGLHALALRSGPLALVQPLLVLSVVFALPLRQLIEHRRIRHKDVIWAVALVAGLVLFLGVSTPAAGSSKPADRLPTMIATAVIGSGILACTIAGRRARGNGAAATLGVAAGLAFAATAGLLKETMVPLARGVGPLLSTWPLYGMITVGLVGLVLNQLAYQAGPLRFSLPVITTIDPIASLVIGVAIFDEHFRSGPAALVGEMIGLVVVVIAAAALARTDPDTLAPDLALQAERRADDN